jgi:putative ABC transport system permease protein
MTTFAAARGAAALGLRWHARTGTLLAVTAALTLIGALPALALLSGSDAAPPVSLDLSLTSALRADWSQAAVVWPQLQKLALKQLFTVAQIGVLLTLAIGAATMIALHLARAAARSGEVLVARAVGASRRTLVVGSMLEAGAIAVVALCVGATLALLATLALRASWPGRGGPADLTLAVAVTLGVTALVMAGPLLLTRALTTRRLVDDDRRPLVLIIPAMQVGAALVVIAGGITLRDLTALQASRSSDARLASTFVHEIRSATSDRLERAQKFSAFLDAQHAAHPGTAISLGSSGVHRGFGITALAMTDCGNCVVGGMAARFRTETIVHHAVSGDSFAVNGLQLRAGRALDDGDRWDAPLVAVVSTSLAKEMFERGDAVGRRIQLAQLNNAWFEVVGVVDDAVVRGLGSTLQPTLAVYVSVLQQPVANIEVATAGTPLAADVIAVLGTPRAAATSIAERLAPETAAMRWFTRLFLGSGVVATLIAFGGLIAMLRLWLDSQRMEFGVRRAVGASRAAIHRMVLGRTALIAVGGSAFGAWMGLMVWDVLPRVAPGAPTWDGTAVALASLALTALTLGVAWLVARRFTRAPIGMLLIDAA